MIDIYACYSKSEASHINMGSDVFESHYFNNVGDLKGGILKILLDILLMILINLYFIKKLLR